MSALPTLFQKTLSDHSLLHRGEHVLAALSGGPDSMALALALAGLREPMEIRLTVAILDHGLRGGAGGRDVEFVQRWAAGMRVPCLFGTADVETLAKEEDLSVEAAARKARYAFLVDQARLCGATVIATGHTLDDQAETVLLQLARGAGVRGLRGIAYRTHREGIRIIRPLRDVSRADVLSYLQRSGQTYCEDETNRDPRFLRNRVRNTVLPLLAQQLTPAIREMLVRTSLILAEEDEWMEAMAGSLLNLVRASDAAEQIDVVKLNTLPVAAKRRVLRAWMRDGGTEVRPDFDALGRIMGLLESTEGTREVPIGGSCRVVRAYDRLRVQCELTMQPDQELHVLEWPGVTDLSDLGVQIRIEETIGRNGSESLAVGHVPAAGSVSREQLAGRPLAVRTWRPGDRIAPTGMAGTRKLQDIFTDARLPKDERHRIPLIVCGDEVIWLPGYSVSRGWTLDSEDEPSITIWIGRRQG